MKRAIFIGQAMPKNKRNPHDWPSLNRWLYSIGLNDKHIKEKFLYSALVDYFPGSINGSHVVPSKKDVKKEKKRLSKMIVDFAPELIIPVGRLSISYCLGRKVEPLKNQIGNSYRVDPYFMLGNKVAVIPLPHPSGASTWRHIPGNKKLLLRALRLLRDELGN